MVSWRVKAEDGGWAFWLQLEGGDHVELVQSGICQDGLQNTRVQPLAGRWEKVKDWGEQEDKDNQWKFNLQTNMVFVFVLFCCFWGGDNFHSKLWSKLILESFFHIVKLASCLLSLYGDWIFEPEEIYHNIHHQVIDPKRRQNLQTHFAWRSDSENAHQEKH